MKIIKGTLHKKFGKEMNVEVNILVPHKRQHQNYTAKFAQLRLEGWTEAELPRLQTIDSSIGTECNHAIIDLSIHSLATPAA